MKGEFARLLRAMVVKEIRTTFRERHQKLALVLVFAFGLCGILIPAGRWAHFAKQREADAAAARPTATTTATTAPTTAATLAKLARAKEADEIRAALLPKNPVILRWAVLAATAALALLYAFGLLANSAIASFAGEKEAKTLELSLASPASSGRLFAGKCVAALVPGLTMAYAFVLLAVLGLWILVRGEMAKLPLNVPFHALVLSVPLLVLPAIALVIAGVAGSARAETVKGAGQVIGVAIIVIMVGVGVVPLLLRFTPLGPPLGRALMAWIEFPFALQYFALIVVLAGIDVALFFAGRALVQRDRMLL